MQSKKLLHLALISTCAAQSLTEALNGQNDTLSVLNGLLAQYPDLVNTLNSASNITVLAPNNDALNNILRDVDAADSLADSGTVTALLQYHVLTGTYFASNFTDDAKFIPTLLTNETFTNVTGGQRVEAQADGDSVNIYSALKQKVTVVQPNVNFTGGTIHIIDGVLSIPQNDTATLTAANLTALAGAVQTSNLDNTLATRHDVTIFAPNNDAFNAIGSVVGSLSNEDLANVLGYHIVEGQVLYSTLINGNNSLRATNGDELKVTVNDGNVYVNAAKVTLPDVLVSNGVAHVINQVLNPSNNTVTPDPTATTAPPAFSGGATHAAAAAPLATGAVGAVALFGGAALLVNI
ncbi:FAS1 domain-containing protein [Pseudomassariella vexata]|uniref:FAS1 domain-containing protein n=1 Tax=Pseudomassariella vexata TaxID=1141098 RepID=A0A1Y2EH77_9PEZI|nr:FAS1 domain-containing protein [Pseudomassariella vexata]ORY70929.1 FAS1 domain-containing protein [Pseudomassariella vexata]